MKRALTSRRLSVLGSRRLSSDSSGGHFAVSGSLPPPGEGFGESFFADFADIVDLELARRAVDLSALFDVPGAAVFHGLGIFRVGRRAQRFEARDDLVLEAARH